MKSNVYTRGGDKGMTSLVGGKRVAKNAPRLEAYGTVDELNSWLGLLASKPEGLPEGEEETLLWAQNVLFDIGAILATEAESTWQPAPLDVSCVLRLEGAIDRLDSTLPRHNRFILPGGTPLSAQAQIARTVARRAERRILDLRDTDGEEYRESPELLCFINRLSDYLFVLARAINNISGEGREIFWQKSC